MRGLQLPSLPPGNKSSLPGGWGGGCGHWRPRRGCLGDPHHVHISTSTSTQGPGRESGPRKGVRSEPGPRRPDLGHFPYLVHNKPVNREGPLGKARRKVHVTHL